MVYINNLQTGWVSDSDGFLNAAIDCYYDLRHVNKKIENRLTEEDISEIDKCDYNKNRFIDSATITDAISDRYSNDEPSIRIYVSATRIETSNKEIAELAKQRGHIVTYNSRFDEYKIEPAGWNKGLDMKTHKTKVKSS